MILPSPKQHIWTSVLFRSHIEVQVSETSLAPSSYLLPKTLAPSNPSLRLDDFTSYIFPWRLRLCLYHPHGSKLPLSSQMLLPPLGLCPVRLLSSFSVTLFSVCVCDTLTELQTGLCSTSACHSYFLLTPILTWAGRP